MPPKSPSRLDTPLKNAKDKKVGKEQRLDACLEALKMLKNPEFFGEFTCAQVFDCLEVAVTLLQVLALSQPSGEADVEISAKMKALVTSIKAWGTYFRDHKHELDIPRLQKFVDEYVNVSFTILEQSRSAEFIYCLGAVERTIIADARKLFNDLKPKVPKPTLVIPELPRTPKRRAGGSPPKDVGTPGDPKTPGRKIKRARKDDAGTPKTNPNLTEVKQSFSQYDSKQLTTILWPEGASWSPQGKIFDRETQENLTLAVDASIALILAYQAEIQSSKHDPIQIMQNAITTVWDTCNIFESSLYKGGADFNKLQTLVVEMKSLVTQALGLISMEQKFGLHPDSEDDIVYKCNELAKEFFPKNIPEQLRMRQQPPLSAELQHDINLLVLSLKGVHARFDPVVTDRARVGSDVTHMEEDAGTSIEQQPTARKKTDKEFAAVLAQQPGAQAQPHVSDVLPPVALPDGSKCFSPRKRWLQASRRDAEGAPAVEHSGLQNSH